MKSTVEQIRERFDHDVERFSNLETGQSAQVDAPLVLDLLTTAAAAVNPDARAALDVGCGAGNYTLKLLQRVPNLDVTLVDLSRPMLDRAMERLAPATEGKIVPLQGDIREIALGAGEFDIIMAGAVLHHLREEAEWRAVFAKLHRALRPGGSLWVADHVEQSIPAVQHLMWDRWGEYLTELNGEAYRDHVYSYVAQEDTPSPLLFQLDMLREAGFRQVDVLHKSSFHAAFGAVKAGVG
jgi:tRNA (cmo5U34)-methyltransferase